MAIAFACILVGGWEFADWLAGMNQRPERAGSNRADRETVT
jgi:hypothetical protein